MAWMSPRPIAFLKKYADEIVAASSVMGVVVGVFGFAIAFYQLSATQNAIRAANAYELQRDSRELLTLLTDNKSFDEFVRGANEAPLTPEIERSLWLAFNFYQSVFRQHKSGGLPEIFANSFKADFCGFVRVKNVDRAWVDMKNRFQISDQHQGMRDEWCK